MKYITLVFLCIFLVYCGQEMPYEDHPQPTETVEPTPIVTATVTPTVLPTPSATPSPTPTVTPSPTPCRWKKHKVCFKEHGKPKKCNYYWDCK